MDIQLLAMQSQVSSYKSYYDSLSTDANTAISNANQFFDSIAGAQGLISFILHYQQFFKMIFINLQRYNAMDDI
jgi:hypothetical protein